MFRQVIGLWFSLLNSPGFGLSDVFPPVNHQGIIIIIIFIIIIINEDKQISWFACGFHERHAVELGPN